MSKNKDKVCSYCGKEDITVHRDSFDGMCAECTTASLYDETISDKAQENNRRMKNDYGYGDY